VRKNYQIDADAAATAAGVAMPESVTLAMAELTGALKEGLLALAVGAGLQVMAAVMEERRRAGRPEGPPRPGPGGWAAWP